MGDATIEELITSESERITAELQEIASWASSEEDLRHETNKLLDRFIAQAGLRIRGRHEYGLAGGRGDSKYAGLIIEYKAPHGANRLGPSQRGSGARALTAQMTQRFNDFEREQRVPLPRLFGVGTDGVYIVFARFRRGRLEVDPPKPVTPQTVARLLRALVSLGAQGKAFTPEHLAEDFGSTSEVAQGGVKRFFEAITHTKNPKAQTLFQEWKILFSEVAGHEVQTASNKMKQLSVHYGLPESADPSALLFSIHSYYAVLIKLLAAEIVYSFSPIGTSPLRRAAAAPTPEALRAEVERLEQGGIWSQLGISNFLEGDLFSWYVPAWDKGVAAVVSGLVARLDDYDPGTLSVDPNESRDLLKLLYQQLFPKNVRHDLGEYYTPDWLADHVLTQVGYDGNPDTRLLDPACGSGTFLVLAINRVKQWFEAHRHECGYGESTLVQKLLDAVVGFDLNPLAVMTARTNYLIAIRDLLQHTPAVELPVFLCDSVITPAEYGDVFIGGYGKVRRLKTAAGTFLLPTEVASRRRDLAQYADMLEFSVRHEHPVGQFLKRCREAGLTIGEVRLHKALYKQLSDLAAENRNGIWTRIIKNAFAPLFLDKVDVVAGNPPWINWESLPPDYRDDSYEVWKHYGLVGTTAHGKRQRSDRSKTDLSILMTYVSADKYLKDRGRLGFVITRSVFQSELGGRRFRRFVLPDGTPLGVRRVDDFDSLKPFRGRAANVVATVALEKGTPTRYPVGYVRWEPGERSPVGEDTALDEVVQRTRRLQWVAYPVQAHSKQSSWIAGASRAVEIARGIVGPSHYSRLAREGINTRGANGVFFVDILGRERGRSLARNRAHDSDADAEVPTVEQFVEDEVLYPLLRGRDVQKWTAMPRCAVLIPHDPRRPTQLIPFADLGDGVQEFLQRFAAVLRARKRFRNFDPKGTEWYGLYSVLNSTFAPHKVVWKEMATASVCAVVSSASLYPGAATKVVVPDHKLMIIPLASREEAHYVAGVLNSSPARYIVRSFAISTGISTHILEKLPISGYRPDDELHAAIRARSAKCHELAADGSPTALTEHEQAIDRAVARAWGISPQQLRVLQSALRELEASGQRGLADGGTHIGDRRARTFRRRPRPIGRRD